MAFEATRPSIYQALQKPYILCVLFSDSTSSPRMQSEDVIFSQFNSIYDRDHSLTGMMVTAY